MNKYIPLVFGEPKSINSEIISKAWKKSGKIKKKIFVIGNYYLFKKQLKKFKIRINLKKINNFKNLKKENNILYILDVPLNDKFVINCINLAHKLSIDGKVKGFVNAPINKKIFNSRYLGLTEYLSKKNKLKNTEIMMIFNKRFAVVPLTTHINLQDVTKKITKQMIVRKILSLNTSYQKYFKKKPRIAILGLNPHNSEGKIGSIENRIIKPAINYLVKKKTKIVGPFPADTIFFKKKLKYDVIVGMYHDQVLAPFKAISGFNAINITLGLKYLRISPDHGVGEDIIGLNRANSNSLLLSMKYLNKLTK